jgi:hypothetical protein
VTTRYVPIYLNDHLAGATLGVELARRALKENDEGELGDFLRWLVAQLVEDRAALVSILRGHGRQSLAKVAGGWAAEKIGRLKTNGHLTTYSPLSRLVELEGLRAGIEAKLSLWRAVEAAGVADVERLIARAEEQRDRLEPHRLAAAQTALG